MKMNLAFLNYNCFDMQMGNDFNVYFHCYIFGKGILNYVGIQAVSTEIFWSIG